MPRFEFKCFEPYISFGSRLNVSGKVDQFDWTGIDIFEDLPDVSGLEISWHVISGRSVFEYYATNQAERGKKVCDRIPNFAEYWANSKGMIRRFSEKSIEITLSYPHSMGFESFISIMIASGQGLHVLAPRVTFASKESAPSPTVRAFMEDYEPAFFGNSDDDWGYSTFVPYRQKQPESAPNTVESSDSPMITSAIGSVWRSILKAATS